LNSRGKQQSNLANILRIKNVDTRHKYKTETFSHFQISCGKISQLTKNSGFLFCSVADPGFIPDPNVFHPGSEFFPSLIRIKEFQYFTPKIDFLSSRKYDPGCSSRIRIRNTAILLTLEALVALVGRADA
jgi:hypothetical protein